MLGKRFPSPANGFTCRTSSPRRIRGGGPAGFGGGRGQDMHARFVTSLEDAYRGATRVMSLRVPAVDEFGEVGIQERNISVAIPKGIREGQHIRLPGQGMPAFDAKSAGDLFLEVAFAPHPVYRVDGADLSLDLPVAPWEAALGGKVIMPTPGINTTVGAGSRIAGELSCLQRP